MLNNHLQPVGTHGAVFIENDLKVRHGPGGIVPVPGVVLRIKAVQVDLFAVPGLQSADPTRRRGRAPSQKRVERSTDNPRRKLGRHVISFG